MLIPLYYNPSYHDNIQGSVADFVGEGFEDLGVQIFKPEIGMYFC